MYIVTEKGYFVGLWNVIKRRGKLNCFKSFDKFYNHWFTYAECEILQPTTRGVDKSMRSVINGGRAFLRI